MFARSTPPASPASTALVGVSVIDVDGRKNWGTIALLDCQSSDSAESQRGTV